MRIIAGKAGRTKLEVPRKASRPTTDRVREALFSILGARVEGARVLDLFAGSGALGLEALSRGAEGAVFVDASAEACKTIEENIARSRLEGATVRRAKVEMFLRGAAGGGEKFDLIFADPPYEKEEGDRDYAGELLGNGDLANVLDAEGRLVLELREGKGLTGGEGWEVEDERRYGDTKIAILRGEEER